MTTRKYLQTHPWIDFRIDLTKLSYKTWLLLGEAESKCQHLAGAPLAPKVAQDLHQIYLSKGIHGTTSIEGNTLSEEQVLARVEGDLPLSVSKEYLGREIDNILDISNEMIRDLVAGKDISITPDRIREFNRRILEGLPKKDDVLPGQTRAHSVTVGISSYRGAPAEDCDFLLEELSRWLESLKAPDDKPELRFPLAVVKAVMAHLYLAWIHPFGDGNGRTARLIEFQMMVEAGAPLPAAHLLSDHYNQTRDAYYVELDRTSKGDFPIEGFIQYALQGFVDELREQINVVRGHQMEVAWRDYVHDVFRDEDTKAKVRQRHLVVDMPAFTWVPRNKIREVSTRIAGEYAGREAKTISRDLNELQKRGLLRWSRKGYMANRQAIEAFLPITLDPVAEAV